MFYFVVEVTNYTARVWGAQCVSLPAVLTWQLSINQSINQSINLYLYGAKSRHFTHIAGLIRTLQVSILVLLDFSVAFDTVNHNNTRLTGKLNGTFCHCPKLVLILLKGQGLLTHQTGQNWSSPRLYSGSSSVQHLHLFGCARIFFN